MVATPQPDDAVAQIKAIRARLDVLSRSRYVSYLPIPLISTAANNNYTNSTTSPQQTAIAGYTFGAAPAIHVGYYVELFASGGPATAQLQLLAVDQPTGNILTLLTTTGGILTATSAGDRSDFLDTVYTVPPSMVGHQVVLMTYQNMLTGTGAVTAHPIYAREAAS